MLKFSANLTMLFTEVDFLDRFERAAGAGFTAIEYMSPYAYEAGQLTAKLHQYGLTQVLFNLPVGRWEAGERGIALLPGRIGEFQEGVAWTPCADWESASPRDVTSRRPARGSTQ